MPGSKQAVAIGQPSKLRRLRRVEEWRRVRFQRLLDDPTRREEAIHAARLYIDVGTRRMAAERGLINR